MIENPANFKNARAVGAYVGLAARGCPSGEIEDDGHISKRGNGPIRGLALRSGDSGPNRIKSESALRERGVKLKERAGRRARGCRGAEAWPAIMHAMWLGLRPEDHARLMAPPLRPQGSAISSPSVRRHASRTSLDAGGASAASDRGGTVIPDFGPRLR
jgi:hypothetical protein